MACTTILVGKAASLDGAPLIARNEDGHNEPNPQRFVVVRPEDQPRVYPTFRGGVEIELPDDPLRYTSTPNADYIKQGLFGGSGINSANVAMTATETITSNPRVLAADPYVDASIGEADILTLVLPYIRTAKEGVLRMGTLLERYGTYEPNGMAFSDADEIWYMETYGGHHWAAIRIPDDTYVVAPNRLNIDDFDFDSPDVLYAEGLSDLITTYRLNPDTDRLNLRHTLGSSTVKDTVYNNARVWYIQKQLSDTSRPYNERYPFVDDPNCHELPFICYPKRKLSIEDVKWALSSHFENTPFDVYGAGTEAQRKRYRAVGLNRNMESHILQIRPDKPAAIAGVHWLALASNAYNCMVPFYANVDDTPVIWRDTPIAYDPNYMYWIVQTMAVIGDRDYAVYGELVANFEKEMMTTLRRMQLLTDARIESGAVDDSRMTAELGAANEEMAQTIFKATVGLLGRFVTVGSTKMDLQYTLAD